MTCHLDRPLLRLADIESGETVPNLHPMGESARLELDGEVFWPPQIPPEVRARMSPALRRCLGFRA